uniref:lysozyme n=1 Tax=Steinernema glaseri TaxID=37863 RepID=A0A1I7Z6C9_9BILA
MLAKCLLLALLVSLGAAKDCLRCMCEQESRGCRAIGCNPDKGSLSCGYYQIKLPYYIDCGTPGKRSGESNESAWKRCADDYDCATNCVKAYIKRYSSKCPGKGSCEKTARLHNGGPNGCNVGGTVGYWNKVQRCCGCS